MARSSERGLAWRREYLRLTYEAGVYRSYEGIVREAAASVGLAHATADELIERWAEIEPWPEAPEVVRALRDRGLALGVATNCSIALGKIAVTAVGAPIAVVVTAEEAGYYKPHPRPYRLALERLGCAAEEALFVAGSASDVPGAAAVGMRVFWHNRQRLPAPARSAPRALVEPLEVAESLAPVLDLVDAS